jgi:diacylglycerol kinase (ATP)
MGVAVIANPTSGRGKGEKLIPSVDALLRSMDVPHTMEICRGPEDPERLARVAAEGGADVVAALGGDGQVGLCANGLIGTGSALAVIPAGSGNDFAKHIGLDPKDPLAAARLLAQPVTRAIDVVRVKAPEGVRYFVNVAGAGFDSEANVLANRTRLLKGTAKYVYSVLVTLARFKAGEFVVRIDGEQHVLPAMMVTVGNASSYGGGMRVCPDASLEDGVLDVCVLGKVSKFEFVKTFPKVFKGRHVDHPAVTMLRAKEIEISADRAFQLFGDGEPMGSLPVSLSVMPGALRVVMPA